MDTIADNTFTFDWRPAEHARVVQFINREYFSTGMWKVAGWIGRVFVAIIVLLGFLAGIGGDWSFLISLIPWLVVLGLWVWLLRTGVGWLAAWQTKRHDPSVRYPFTFSLTDSGLRQSTQIAEHELKWTGCYKVRERSDSFLFYYNKRCAYHLPKRAIGSESAITRVRELIRSRLPSGVPFSTDMAV